MTQEPGGGQEKPYRQCDSTRAVAYVKMIECEGEDDSVQHKAMRPRTEAAQVQAQTS